MMSPHEKEVPSLTVCCHFLCFYKKNFQVYPQLLITEGKPCSTFANCHMTKHVTSKWPKSTSCLKMKSYLCHLSKSGIYTTFYLRAICIVKKTQYYCNLFWSAELLSDLSPKLISRKLTFQTWTPHMSTILKFPLKGTLLIAFF